MTRAEEQAIAQLETTINDFISGMQQFKDGVSQRVVTVERQVQQVHAPLYLEKDILSTAQQAIAESIKTVLTGYSSPLTKLVTSVIDDHAPELRAIVNEAFTKVIRTEDFKDSIVQAFAHKVGRALVANNDGLFDKVGNDLKQDPQFRAKLTLAVAGVVEECIKIKS